MSALQANPFLMAGRDDDGYKIERSLRFFDENSACLTRTTGNATSSGTWTWSGWIKRSELSMYQGIVGGFTSGSYTSIYFDTNDRLFYYDPSVEFTIDNKRFRDVSAWYHLCIVHSASSSITFYANGVQFYQHTSNVPSTTRLNGNSTNAILGARLVGATSKNFHFHGYMTEINFIDGQALAPTAFGEFDANNIWQPLEYTGTYGNNGYYLNFSDNSSLSNLGSDSSGNNNDFTANFFEITADDGNDSVIDTPTDYQASPNNGGNYATINPLRSGSGTVIDGNLRYNTPTNNNGFRASTIGMSSGKWYWEVTWHSGYYPMIGMAGTENPTGNGRILGYSSTSYAYMFNGKKIHNSSQSSYGNSLSTGDVIGVAFDADNGTLTFYRNGTSQGQAYTGITSGPYFAASSDYNTSTSCTFLYNFGQRPFEYTQPTGYLTLCTANLPEPTVADGSQYFDTKTYTGTGNALNITGLNFSPDLVWIRNRSSTYSHCLYDTIRGVGKRLASDGTWAEDTYNLLTNFNANGFSLGSNFVQNASGVTSVAWAWDAGSSTVSNTNGSITSQVRANPTAGFSICTYTSPNNSSNQSFGHGLNSKPGLVLVKNRDNSYNWDIYHSSLGYNSSLIFTSAGTRSGAFSSEPTSTVVNTKHDYTHVGTNKYVAYCFAAIEGYSAMGSYTGNGSTDGPFVYTGFRPRWILQKSTVSETYGHWHIYDTERDSNNPVDLELYANLSYAEGNIPGGDFDILSNGFKVRTYYSGGWNTSGTSYIYAAFAEHPFKTSRAR